MVRSIPIVEPDATQTIGLVVPDRVPAPPLTTGLVAEARQLAKVLDDPPGRRDIAGEPQAENPIT
jgi:hypothetical protein